MATGRSATLNLYRSLIRETKKWDSYNFRMYALRKIRHEFQENKGIQDQGRIADLLKKGEEQLGMIKRQAAIGNMYSTRHLVIESTKSHKH